MELGQKLRLLRSLEGNLRGLGRPMTQAEVARLMGEEGGEAISQAYLSQIESGKRRHLTVGSRDRLAAFFRVHPGYLVDDPAGYQSQLATPALREVRLDSWLAAAADDLRPSDPELAGGLAALATLPDTRRAVLLMARLAAQPQLLDRLDLPAQPAAAPIPTPAPRNP